MALDSATEKLPLPRGFIPQGHNKIMPIRVIHAWHHAETNCWLSIQAIGPAMALVWRASDDWAATPHLAEEICQTLDRDENLRSAYRVGEFLLGEGPPKGLIESAERSAEVRREKAAKGGRAKAEKARQTKLASIECSHVPDLEDGPKEASGRWDWEGYTDSWEWRETSEECREHNACFLMQRAKDQTYGLIRNWVTKDGVLKTEALIDRGTLSQCFGVMEHLAKKTPARWRQGDLESSLAGVRR